ncbi:MAG TPA: hypothetical protein VHJ77_06605 [Vicinamibacterales bacterium]|jgi:hypothetical protein|nr:hypothetical protein [Vicinamibacterales bacterium]
MRKLWMRAWRLIKRAVAALFVVMLLLMTPVAYVELACRGEAEAGAPAYQPLLTDPAYQRREANTYLTYPEWHIVFAYDGLARALKAGDEHAFGYLRSIAGFWRSTCALTRFAGGHGGADWGTRSMIHTIGVSFTAEMIAKAAYEETIGRATAWLRGPRKTPQDEVVAGMAVEYAQFLRQTPWYEYPFRREARELWAAPVDYAVRGWERRLGIGLEFQAKAAYAKVIAGAVAATEPAQLRIRSIVAGLDATVLSQIPDVMVIRHHQGGLEIETPRYAQFTRILTEIARRGGVIREIAGNDEIMASVTVGDGAAPVVQHGTLILRLKRDGIPGDRLLVNVRLPQLAAFLKAYRPGDPGLEHVFDY